VQGLDLTTPDVIGPTTPTTALRASQESSHMAEGGEEGEEIVQSAVAMVGVEVAGGVGAHCL